MARRDQNLAGLAALGALGYMLRGDSGAATPAVQQNTGGGPAQTPSPGMLYPDESSNTTGQYAPAPPMAVPAGSSAGAASSRAALDPRDLEAGMSRGTRRTSMAGAGRGVVNPQQDAAPAMMSPDDMARIRMVGGARGRTAGSPVMYGGSGPTRGIPNEFVGSDRPDVGERVSGNELTRNLDALMMGRGPTGLTQLGALAGDAATARRAQQAYNARAAARRAAGDLTPEEVAAAKQRIADAASAGGMKRGGKVKTKPAKKMASGGMTRSSASKRADGIATKGKTKGRMI
jgi:hypothetical protein